MENSWWEIFCSTGDISAYLKYKSEEKESGTDKDKGDSNKDDRSGRLQ